MDSETLLEMAELERSIAEEIKSRHPHYFRDDDHGAWGACRTAELRAEALVKLAAKMVA